MEIGGESFEKKLEMEEQKQNNKTLQDNNKNVKERSNERKRMRKIEESDEDDDDFAENTRDFQTQTEKQTESFFDQERDEKDSVWVRQNLSQHSKPQDRVTDAILNCPCCFTLLCLDCQRHETFINQYRAMFVQNCTVDMKRDLRLKIPQTSKRQQKRDREKAKTIAKKQKQKEYQQKRQKQLHTDTKNNQTVNSSMPLDSKKSTDPLLWADLNPAPPAFYEENEKTPDNYNKFAGNEDVDVEDDMQSSLKNADEIYVEDEYLYYPEMYHPVRCKHCHTDVGIFDTDEVYHFFNVIPGEQ